AVKAAIDPVDDMLRSIDDAKALYELGSEAGDAASIAEADQQVADLEKRSAKVETQSLLDGPNDSRNCFFTIQAGAGGTEAQDWTEMLLRMYLYYFERSGWDISEIDRQWGEQAGLKSVTLHVKGDFTFGYLRAEAGVDRLVRPSPDRKSTRLNSSH